MVMKNAIEKGVNPARAGMIPSAMRLISASQSKPRASGDDPEIIRGEPNGIG